MSRSTFREITDYRNLNSSDRELRLAEKERFVSDMFDEMEAANKRALVFDCDGTVLDCHTCHMDAIRALFSTKQRNGSDLIYSGEIKKDVTRDQARALFADAELFEIIVRQAKARGVKLAIASKQSYVAIHSLMEKAFGREFVEVLEKNGGIHGNPYVTGEFTADELSDPRYQALARSLGPEFNKKGEPTGKFVENKAVSESFYSKGDGGIKGNFIKDKLPKIGVQPYEVAYVDDAETHDVKYTAVVMKDGVPVEEEMVKKGNREELEKIGVLVFGGEGQLQPIERDKESCEAKADHFKGDQRYGMKAGNVMKLRQQFQNIIKARGAVPRYTVSPPVTVVRDETLYQNTREASLDGLPAVAATVDSVYDTVEGAGGAMASSGVSPAVAAAAATTNTANKRQLPPPPPPPPPPSRASAANKGSPTLEVAPGAKGKGVTHEEVVPVVVEPPKASSSGVPLVAAAAASSPYANVAGDTGGAPFVKSKEGDYANPSALVRSGFSASAPAEGGASIEAGSGASLSASAGSDPSQPVVLPDKDTLGYTKVNAARAREVRAAKAMQKANEDAAEARKPALPPKSAASVALADELQALRDEDVAPHAFAGENPYDAATHPEDDGASAVVVGTQPSAASIPSRAAPPPPPPRALTVLTSPSSVEPAAAAVESAAGRVEGSAFERLSNALEKGVAAKICRHPNKRSWRNPIFGRENANKFVFDGASEPLSVNSATNPVFDAKAVFKSRSKPSVIVISEISLKGEIVIVKTTAPSEGNAKIDLSRSRNPATEEEKMIEGIIAQINKLEREKGASRFAAAAAVSYTARQQNPLFDDNDERSSVGEGQEHEEGGLGVEKEGEYDLDTGMEAFLLEFNLATQIQRVASELQDACNRLAEGKFCVVNDYQVPVLSENSFRTQSGSDFTITTSNDDKTGHPYLIINLETREGLKPWDTKYEIAIGGDSVGRVRKIDLGVNEAPPAVGKAEKITAADTELLEILASLRERVATLQEGASRAGEPSGGVGAFGAAPLAGAARGGGRGGIVDTFA